jgi:hypothetical protein
LNIKETDNSMCADGVYDRDFFAAMADRGFYIFTSRPIVNAKPQACDALSSGPALSTAAPCAEASADAQAEAA